MWRIIRWGYRWWNVTVRGGDEENENDNYDTPKLFKNLYSLCVSRVFGVRSGWRGEWIDGRVFLVTCRIRYVDSTVLEGSMEPDTRSCHHQKRYADTFGKNMGLTVQQIVGQILVVVELWKAKKPKVHIRAETERLERKDFWVRREMPHWSWSLQDSKEDSLRYHMNSSLRSLVETWGKSSIFLLQNSAETTAK